MAQWYIEPALNDNGWDLCEYNPGGSDGWIATFGLAQKAEAESAVRDHNNAEGIHDRLVETDMALGRLRGVAAKLAAACERCYAHLTREMEGRTLAAAEHALLASCAAVLAQYREEVPE